MVRREISSQEGRRGESKGGGGEERVRPRTAGSVPSSKGGARPAKDDLPDREELEVCVGPKSLEAPGAERG